MKLLLCNDPLDKILKKGMSRDFTGYWIAIMGEGDQTGEGIVIIFVLPYLWWLYGLILLVPGREECIDVGGVRDRDPALGHGAYRRCCGPDYR